MLYFKNDYNFVNVISSYTKRTNRLRGVMYLI